MRIYKRRKVIRKKKHARNKTNDHVYDQVKKKKKKKRYLSTKKKQFLEKRGNYAFDFVIDRDTNKQVLKFYFFFFFLYKFPPQIFVLGRQSFRWLCICLNSVFSFALQNVSNQEVLPDAAAAQPDGQTSRPHQQFCLEPLKLHAPRHYKVGLLCFFFVFFD